MSKQKVPEFLELLCKQKLAAEVSDPTQNIYWIPLESRTPKRLHKQIQIGCCPNDKNMPPFDICVQITRDGDGEGNGSDYEYVYFDLPKDEHELEAKVIELTTRNGNEDVARAIEGESPYERAARKARAGKFSGSKPMVVVIKNNVLEWALEYETEELAQRVFVAKCQKLDPKAKEKDLLNAGYFEHESDGHDRRISIVWPQKGGPEDEKIV